MSFSLAHITHVCMSTCIHTHICTGHFRGPQISGVNACAHTHTLTNAGHFRGPQISGASQTMNETGNKNTESIWSHICFLWRYECLYYSPLADSYILLSTPALLVSLQTSSKAIYLHGYNPILDLTSPPWEYRVQKRSKVFNWSGKRRKTYKALFQKRWHDFLMADCLHEPR